MDPGIGDECISIQPWKFTIREPIPPLVANSTPPDVMYKLEYAYGYSCKDSRQNLYYTYTNEIVYPAGSLGVILNLDKNS